MLKGNAATAGDKVRDSVVDQVSKWLAFSPEQKRQYMEAHTEVKELNDMSHPAYRRFKEVNEPWGLRKMEYALHFRKVGFAAPDLNSSLEGWEFRLPGMIHRTSCIPGMSCTRELQGSQSINLNDLVLQLIECDQCTSRHFHHVPENRSPC